MKIHIDTCISDKLAKAIKLLDERKGIVEISVHSEHFSGHTPDVEWLSKMREMDISAILTADDRIRWNPDERRAWIESGTTAYVVSDHFTRQKFWGQVEELVKIWPKITEHARRATPGTLWSIPWKQGKISELPIPPDRPKPRPDQPALAAPRPRN